MGIPERKFDAGSGYRYGFNGKENDNEVSGNGKKLDFGARIYDSRLGRWLSLDPIQAKYPDLSPYNFVANSPIRFIDPDGKVIRVYYSNGKYYDYKPGVQPPKGSPEIVMKIHEACVYSMHSKTGAEVWNQLSDSKGIFEISYVKATAFNTSSDSKVFDFNPDNLGKKNANGEEIIGSLNWDYNADLSVLDDHGFLKGFFSPSTVLLHELGHAKDADKALTDSKTDKNAIVRFKALGTQEWGYNMKFDTEAEHDNITGVENPYIREINSYEQINGGSSPSYQPVRTNHKGTLRSVNNERGIKIDVNRVDSTRYLQWQKEEGWDKDSTKVENDGIKR